MQAERSWTSTLPFLMLAYPVTFLLFQGGRYCSPICFSPTLSGVISLAVSLLVLGPFASGVAVFLGTVGIGDDYGFVRRLATPPRLARAVLLGLFGAFIVFLTLDALTLYEAIWKPIILPISLLLFAPVWALYVATFPLAILFSVAGIDPSAVVTLATRAVIIAVGFPLSAVVQTYAVSTVVSGHESSND